MIGGAKDNFARVLCRRVKLRYLDKIIHGNFLAVICPIEHI
jgi:hypothetical protein